MDSAVEHNQVLQINGMFTAADLEENKHGQYSPSQLERFQAGRDFMNDQAGKYSNGKFWVALIFAVGFVFFLWSCILSACLKFCKKYWADYSCP